MDRSIEPILDTREVAYLLDVTPQTVIRYIKEGRIIARRYSAGGKFRTPLSEVLRFIENSKRK